jgi:hypothetical protein
MKMKRINIKSLGIINDSVGRFNDRSHFKSDGVTPKISYNSRAIANKVARRMVNKYKTSFSVYRCLICGRYHIGNTF